MTITPATVTITGPKVAKEYDGKPYSGELKATITGLPTSGSPVNYTLTDVSGEVNLARTRLGERRGWWQSKLPDCDGSGSVDHY
ncbi:hypothetical protein [Secundilactobacillus kimchicus]|uniref:hypothetical protein n=1 Tax=Secundilactobacillus kimchicus TaxID=528209 RepID=UPI0006D1A856|nr:hypothetical protein [Secundilactobacillus kimchicus]